MGQDHCFLFFGVVLLILRAGASEEDIEGPCRSWYRSCKGHEAENQWKCTSVEEYIHYTISGCPHDPLIKPPPPPVGRCVLVNDVCQFDSSSTLQCAFRHSYWDFCQMKCMEVNGSSKDDNCTYDRFPPPDALCLLMNDQCQEYKPCKFWKSPSSQLFQCGTFDEYYEFKFGPHQSHARQTLELVNPIPPGECILQNNSCSWSKCLGHKDLCEEYWMCGSAYDAAVYYAPPPHPCPAPPTPPTQPGKCVFNMTASKCKFTGKNGSITERTNEDKHVKVG